MRFARSLVGFLRETLKSLILRALDRPSLFLCDKNAFLLDCLIDRGELAPRRLHCRAPPLPGTTERDDGWRERDIATRSYPRVIQRAPAQAEDALWAG